MRASVAALLREALAAYVDDPPAVEELRRAEARLAEPVRVVIAGMTRAGKSTLLNAVVGERVAIAGGAESTRMITWYRYGPAPRVTLHPTAGAPRLIRVRQRVGGVVLDLDGVEAGAVERLEVEWPSAMLRDVMLIDTPGLANVDGSGSARARAFLAPEEGPSEADALLYVLRRPHVADITVLRAFRDLTAGDGGVVNAVAVLSRADEVGAGRIDSLLSAREIAERYRHDGLLDAVVDDVVPVAGLLAETARTLRAADFVALERLSRLGKPERERLLVSADRFVRHDPGLPVDDDTRAALLARLGVFGVRLCLALIRGGVRNRDALAHELARRSGLDDLSAILDGRFREWSGHLRARSALHVVDGLLRDRPPADVEQLLVARERVAASDHDLAEMLVLSAARRDGLPLPPGMAVELRRLVGGSGRGSTERLDLAPDAAHDAVRVAAAAALDRWRRRSEDPLVDRDVVELCRVAVRTCEAVLAGLVPAGTPESAPPPRTGAPPGPEPRVRLGRQAHDESRAG